MISSSNKDCFILVASKKQQPAVLQDGSAAGIMVVG